MPDLSIDPALELPVHVAEVITLYAGQVFDVRHFGRGSYTIGDSAAASFPLSSSASLDPEFPLVDWRAGAIELRFTAEMRGELVRGEERRSLAELIASGRAAPRDGAFVVTLAADERAWITVGAVSFALRSVPAARRPAYPGGLRWEWRSHALVMFVVLGGLWMLARHQANEAAVLRFEVTSRVARFVHTHAEPDAPRTVRERITLPPPRVRAEGQPNVLGESGRSGKRTKATHRRINLARRVTGPQILTRRFNVVVEPEGERLGVHGSTAGFFFTSDHSAFAQASGVAVRDWIGSDGRRKGDASGIGGLGVYGTWRSAGGWAVPGGLGGVGGTLSGARRSHGGEAWRHHGVIGPLGLAEVRRVVGWRAAALRRCGSLGGASLQFTINGVGLVGDVDVTATGARETRAANCVARQIRRMWFPRGVGTLRVGYPLEAPDETP